MLYELSDDAHQRIRAFRNILLSAATLIAAFMAIFVGVVAWFPQTIPFCFTPNATGGPAEPGAVTMFVCPRGSFTGPSVVSEAEDIAIIAGLGLLGGALAAAIAVRKMTGRATPYGVPTALALLKVPTGALTAVSGILLLGGGFVPGLSELDSQRQIVAYALVLGYAQQAVTCLIDDRANALLAAVPAKGGQMPATTPSVHTAPVGLGRDATTTDPLDPTPADPTPADPTPADPTPAEPITAHPTTAELETAGRSR
jgi:hypothetical protein